MKTLNFEQMENVKGGDCFWEGVAFLGSGITAMIPGAGWLGIGLAVLSYGQYFACMQKQIDAI